MSLHEDINKEKGLELKYKLTQKIRLSYHLLRKSIFSNNRLDLHNNFAITFEDC